LEEMTNKLSKLEVLLDAMSSIVRPTMLEYFRPDCCVATCKILQAVFAEYRYKARAVAVTVQILNGPMQKLVEQGPLPKDHDERIALFNQHGAWGVGIVPPENGLLKPNSFGGHLVLNVNGLLVDASLQQAQREQKGIMLPPLLCGRPGSNFFAKSKGQRTGVRVGECLVSYKRLRDDSYLTGKDWREEYAGKPETYLKITRLLRERITGKDV
jgi:hypothetical protein